MAKKDAFTMFHLVVQGCSVWDRGTHTEVIWHSHISACAQSDNSHNCIGKFSRNDANYTVWVSKHLPKIMTIAAAKKLVLEHYEYAKNPFGLVENE